MAGRCSCRRCCRWREASPSLATKRGQDAKGANKFISSYRGPPRAMSIDPSRCTCWWVHVIQKRNGSDMAASQTALTYSLSLSLSLSALVARELSFVLLATRSVFPKENTDLGEFRGNTPIANASTMRRQSEIGPPRGQKGGHLSHRMGFPGNGKNNYSGLRFF